MISLFKTDTYKLNHWEQYPKDTDFLYATLTPRTFGYMNQAFAFINLIDTTKFRVSVQAIINDFILKDWNDNFFRKQWTEIDHEMTLLEKGTSIDFGKLRTQFKGLHKMGYLPIHFETHHPKNENEPIITMWNTHPKFFWLVGYLETQILNTIWPFYTASFASRSLHELGRSFSGATCDNDKHLPYQFHDFSQRSSAGNDMAMLTGIGHLQYFNGSDNLPALKYMSKTSYQGLGSVLATEHSVMCAGTQEQEQATYERLINTYPNGVLSIVSDTWNIFNVCDNIIPNLKDKIMARNGTLVIRPDSSDNMKLLFSHPFKNGQGLFEHLGNTFGFTTNSKGYKVLDSHISIIIGDSIDFAMADNIFRKMALNGWASSNIVFGIGGLVYQWQLSRDSLGFALKTTMMHNKESGWTELQKNPIEAPFKKSHKGFGMYKDEKWVHVEPSEWLEEYDYKELMGWLR